LDNKDSEPLEIVLQLAGLNTTLTITDSSGDDYQTSAISSATRTLTQLRDVPQSISVVTNERIKDQGMQTIGDVVRYVPGVTAIQGENNRDQIVIRGNGSSADFFLDGLRDDVQYYRDLYNLEQLEVLKGPNAMIFGRGGGGGVINRVTKQPTPSALRELTFQGGSNRNRRVTADINQPLNSSTWFRVNGAYENSDSFRNYVGLNRLAFNPTVTINTGPQTLLRFGFEHLQDDRVADRGIPSVRGRPAQVDVSSFFGDPKKSRVRSRVNLLTSSFEHYVGKLSVRNRTLLGFYDRFYQNFVPGSVNANANVRLSAYNNSTRRSNFFNQTDLTYRLTMGSTKHTLLGGAEFGHQLSKNFRQTGFFDNSSTTILVPLANPTIDTAITFRQNQSDANNRVLARIAATYWQDQIELTPRVQLLMGLRYDHFDLGFHNNRNGENLSRIDNLLSPRAGIIFRPISPLSLYGSYGVSYLPSSGDQFSSLTQITQTLKPEKFANYEVGAKWDVLHLSVNAALYRLERTNTRAVDPNDPARLVQTGSQRTDGFEAEVNGNPVRRWKISGGYSYQNAFITSATTTAAAGARVAQVPRNTFSLWNQFSLLKSWRVGLGLTHRSDMFAAIDNRVTLPGYTRLDAAVFFKLTEGISLQANLENLLNRRYYLNADGNDNISPGSPRGARVGLSWKF
ncbi:MAG TPA: TonB-dependent siderophore receptor, partial [Pyrinomonadaceae bacterium]